MDNNTIKSYEIIVHLRSSKSSLVCVKCRFVCSRFLYPKHSLVDSEFDWDNHYQRLASSMLYESSNPISQVMTSFNSIQYYNCSHPMAHIKIVHDM